MQIDLVTSAALKHQGANEAKQTVVNVPSADGHHVINTQERLSVSWRVFIFKVKNSIKMSNFKIWELVDQPSREFLYAKDTLMNPNIDHNKDLVTGSHMQAWVNQFSA